MRVSLSNLPKAPKEYALDFPRLDGGLNNWELDYRLDANESPEMENLMWKDGALCCRDGQTRLTKDTPGQGWSAYDRLFWGCGFFHIGSALYFVELGQEEVDANNLTYVKLFDGIPENKGSWFVYDGSLFYKNRGSYTRIEYTPDEGKFSAGAVEYYTPTIQINTEPSTGAGDAYQPENRLSPQKEVWYSTVAGVKEYHLPVQDVDSIDKVEVDGAEAKYTADLTNGIVTFETEPEHHEPVRVNTVKITYTKANPDAYNSVMDCPYAAVYGGDQNICVVMGGCPAQPNAYFWNGNHVAMDAGYFPMEQYNLAGDTEEYITGFGLQQAMLVIFKEHSVGRAILGTTEMGSGRVLITMNYTNINSRVGCDLPWSIQLVENNLVFANTEQGVHIILDSSSAQENNIVGISRKVNNTMLKALRSAETVSSFDEGERYWIVADGEAYVWDYTLSTYSKPSWFYYTAIKGMAFLSNPNEKYHLGMDGHLSVFRRDFMDYGGAIHKVFRFSTQNMGSYDALKDVVGVILATRSDTDTNIRIFYSTDYEYREDLTPVRAYSWRLAPRNLAWRYLGIHRFASVIRRRPGCRHIRHFYMRLENNEIATDMSVISAQILYRFTGRDR